MEEKTYAELDIENMIEIQNKLSNKIIMYTDKKEFKYVSGVDLAYWTESDGEYAVCCIVTLEQKTLQVIESKFTFGKVNIPYILGCLAFRELPLILETSKKLKKKTDLYMFDGNGYLHPRHMGIATHASFYLEKPTIGIAKNYYKIGNTNYRMPINEKNAFTDIIINGDVYGRVLRTCKNVKPIFISVGNFIDLETTTEVVCNFAQKESHIPQPTRLADMETRRIRKIIKDASMFEKERIFNQS